MDLERGVDANSECEKDTDFKSNKIQNMESDADKNKTSNDIYANESSFSSDYDDKSINEENLDKFRNDYDKDKKKGNAPHLEALKHENGLFSDKKRKVTTVQTEKSETNANDQEQLTRSEQSSAIKRESEEQPEVTESPKPKVIRPKKFYCEYCGMDFNKKSNYGKHLRIHTGEKPFKCDLCDAAFTSKSNMNIHKRLHTGEKPFKCDLCEAAFVQKSHLIKHQTVHTGDKLFKCELCSITFTDNRSLCVHKTIHHGESMPNQIRFHRPRKMDEVFKPFRCDICDAAFLQETRLATHMRCHTGEKPFKCDVCSATFSKKGSLTIHQRIHTGEKPFKCKFCNAAFSQKGSLTIHSRIHSADNTNDMSTEEGDSNNVGAGDKEASSITKMTNGVKRRKLKHQNETSEDTPSWTKVKQAKENAFELDPVDPVFSDFIISMHQKANTGEIATDMLFQ